MFLKQEPLPIDAVSSLVNCTQCQAVEETVTEAFSDITDKGGNPYPNHLKSVAIKTIDYHKKLTSLRIYIDLTILIQVALLHDAMEDLGWGEMFMLKTLKCDPKTVNAVKYLTKTKGKTREAYIENITMDIYALIVKLCDLEHNMDVTRLNRPLTRDDYHRLINYSKEYHYLKEVLSDRVRDHSLTRQVDYD